MSAATNRVEKNNKYHQILEAAVRVFARQGFHQSTVAQIAKDAGVADGTIYLYFKSKDDLLISLFESRMERVIAHLTEAIPVGTYTMVLRPGAELASFEFMSERFLELTGLKREEALADPLKGFACVHPEDFDEWVRLNAEAFSNRTPFFGQTRLVVNGEVRWITAESVPRTLADGSIV